jgi:chromosomal replication initiation ATPase DnaA
MAKKASLYLCHRYSGMTLREIGGYFNIGESAVTQASHRFNLQLNKDKKLRKQIELIIGKLNLCNV